ncbi:MAG: hypothetical protein WB691_17825, partial [Pseudolabrys sp.]
QQHLERVAKFARVWREAAAAVDATIVDSSEVLCPGNECVYQRAPKATPRGAVAASRDVKRLPITDMPRDACSTSPTPGAR